MVRLSLFGLDDKVDFRAELDGSIARGRQTFPHF